jgi:hypothetical protein
MKPALHSGTIERKRAAGWLWLAAALCAGCADVEPEPLPPDRDRVMFDQQVWPILVRDCGFGECHGMRERFFRVVGPGHERLDPLMRLTEPVTAAELQFSYDRARSMIDPRDPPRSLLLRKPLEVEAGGAGHEGTDRFGRDVYRTVDDPSFRVLVNWVLAAAPAMQGGGP